MKIETFTMLAMAFLLNVFAVVIFAEFWGDNQYAVSRLASRAFRGTGLLCGQPCAAVALRDRKSKV